MVAWEADDKEMKADLVAGIDMHKKNAVEIGEDLHLVEHTFVTQWRAGSLNHTCDANLWLADEVTIVARHAIATGEELTIDYALFTAQPDWVLEQPCHCGAIVCRQTSRPPR